ncbi:MAG: patatin-like phospholipase family protein [Butyrivibrio sp.]|nr:patatin-like phospholipase family protein [Butyrivibrio sp.]
MKNAESIEDLASEKEVLKYLSKEDMADISDTLRHFYPNLSVHESLSSLAYNNMPKIEIEGYTLQRSRFKNCHLVDPSGIVRAHGIEKVFANTIYRKALENEYLSRISNKEYGLVFAGGAARGAYEIGVWKYLRDIGLEDKITGIAGNSVGALNSLLFLQGDLDKAIDIWNNVTKNDLLQFSGASSDEDRKSRNKRTHDNKNWNEKMNSFIDDLRKNVSIKVADNNVLQLIDKSIYDWDSILNPQGKITYICKSMRAWISFINHNGKFDPEWNRPIYEPLIYLTREQLEAEVLASASMPIIYKKQSINNTSFVDGSLTDNVPYMPLVKAGYKKIIVVHLDTKNRSPLNLEPKGDSMLYHIYPSDSLHSILRISKVLTKGRMDLGYNDAKNILRKF